MTRVYKPQKDNHPWKSHFYQQMSAERSNVTAKRLAAQRKARQQTLNNRRSEDKNG